MPKLPTHTLLAMAAITVSLGLTACATPGAEALDKRVEHIEHVDDRSRIQELRVGGQTESIDVQPQNGAPAYQVSPRQNSQTPNEGRSFWRLFEF